MTLIIAEAGVNHNGDEQLAFELVDAAHKAGADIIKFQTFKAHNLVTEHAQQADYQIANTQKQESQLA
ncbi:N-acetylneuraminate synthase family protein, partial [Escherichia coli]